MGQFESTALDALIALLPRVIKDIVVGEERVKRVRREPSGEQLITATRIRPRSLFQRRTRLEILL